MTEVNQEIKKYKALYEKMYAKAGLSIPQVNKI